jgi:Transposase DDE domain group 1
MRLLSSLIALAMGVVSQAASALLVRTAETVGLTAALSGALAPWRKPLASHDPGKSVADVSIALAIGGDCLADVALLCAESGLFGRVASDPTVSRLIATLAADAPKALIAIASARAAARSAAWRLTGVGAPDHGIDVEAPLVIDLDATLVSAHSDKEQAVRRSSVGTGFILRLRRPRPGRYR